MKVQDPQHSQVFGAFGSSHLANSDSLPLNANAAVPTHEHLPPGVRVIPLTTHKDARGGFTEVFRNSFIPTTAPCQWNLVYSQANVLRGVHLHITHADYLILASGSCLFFLFDCRSDSPMKFQPSTVNAKGHAPFGLYIPPGVAHGFYFYEPSLHVYGVDHYWDTADELGVRFDDPGLKFEWPCSAPHLSERDLGLPSLQDLLRTLHETSATKPPN